MDGVKRYTVKLNQLIGAAMVEDPAGRYVQYDAVSTREAAILRRESLLKEKLADCEKSEATLREELAQAAHMRTFWAESAAELDKRLTAAEQRNADYQRDAERYRKLRKMTPYRIKKMQEASVTDGGDVLYFHADRFDALMDAELTKPTESGASE